MPMRAPRTSSISARPPRSKFRAAKASALVRPLREPDVHAARCPGAVRRERDLAAIGRDPVDPLAVVAAELVDADRGTEAVVHRRAARCEDVDATGAAAP